MVILFLAGLAVAGISAIRKPVAHAGQDVGKAAKKTALVVSQPARHPVKDAKIIFHFFKGDR
jgi:hypothetical protein